MGDMMRKVGFLLFFLGVVAIGVGVCYSIFFKSSNEFLLNDFQIDDTTKVSDVDNNTKNRILEYLNTKYHKDFQVIGLVREFCLEASGSSLTYTNTCTDNNIHDYIYQIKDSNNVSFYVKEVFYNDEYVTVKNSSNSYDISSQQLGFYDSYISQLVVNKLEKKLISLYEELFSTTVDVQVYDGLGVDNITSINSYQYLGGSSQKITDTSISFKEFISSLDTLDNSVSIRVKLDQDITKNNFQSIVSKLVNNKQLLPSDTSLTLDTLLLEFNNKNRYIEKFSGWIELKSGTDIFDSFNLSVYDKTISTFSNSETDDDEIRYDDFMKLNPSDFSFTK